VELLDQTISAEDAWGTLPWAKVGIVYEPDDNSGVF